MSSASMVSTEDEDIMSDITDDDYVADIAGADSINDDGNTKNLREKPTTTATALVLDETCRVQPKSTSVYEDIVPQKNDGMFLSVPSCTNAYEIKDLEPKAIQSCVDQNEPFRVKSACLMSVSDDSVPQKTHDVFRSVPSCTKSSSSKDREPEAIPSCFVRNEPPFRVKSACVMAVDPSLFFSHTPSARGDAFLVRAVKQVFRAFKSRRSIKLAPSLDTEESTLVGELV